VLKRAEGHLQKSIIELELKKNWFKKEDVKRGSPGWVAPFFFLEPTDGFEPPTR
jgi:hypothetical protein